MPNNRIIGWLIWFIASLFYAFQYIIRVLPNILMPEISQKFAMDSALYGQFSGLYYVGYAGMHLPLGILLDRIGPKVVIPICISITALGVLPLVFTEFWLYPTIGRIVIGIGSSAAILGVFKVTRMIFGDEKFTIMLGLSVTIGLLGGIWGGQPVNYLIRHFGWETVLLFICAAGIVLALASYALLPNMKQETSETTILHDVFTVLKNPYVLSICVLGGLMVGPLEGFADVWGTEFLIAVNQFDENIASSLPSFIFLGMCFGSPFLSYLAAKTNRYYELTIISALMMAIGFACILFFDLSITSLTIILSATGVLCAYQILVIYKASTYVKSNLVSITTATANMIIMIFGYFFHSTIGIVIKFFNDPLTSENLITVQAFQNGISVIPIGLLIAGIGFTFLLIKEKRKKLS